MNYKDNYKDNFFNNPCATHIFLMCKVYNTASMLAKKTEITHPYVFRIVKILEKYKLVSTKKVGKFRYLKLTKRMKKRILKKVINKISYNLYCQAVITLRDEEENWLNDDDSFV